MRSFASFVLVVVVGLLAAAVAGAQSSAPRELYTDALLRERALRQEIEKRGPDADGTALLKRIRTLAQSYEHMSRLYPASDYMDNALWQGALLAADAFWSFGEAVDKTMALRLFAALESQFPASSLVKQAPAHVKRLREAKPAPRQARNTGPPAAARPGSALIALTAVRRDVLPDALRITLELGQEVPFKSERIGGPPRVFVDLDNTRAAESIKDATIPFGDDVVRQVRIGRQSSTRTRVVMDLAGAGKHSVYTLYNPYRVVIDFQRLPAAAAAPAVPAVRETASRTEPVVRTLAPALAPVDDLPSPEALPRVADATADGNSPTRAAPDGSSPAGDPAAALPPVAPAAPSSNASGRFSLSRQLGLGVSRVVIDPGHGGHDPGAKTRGLTEADLVLDVALRLEQLLLKQDGFEVALTRRVDTFVPLEERTAIANREGADLFLSIHANASANGAARGVETYFLNLAATRDAEIVAARENAASSRSMRQLPDIVKTIALNNKIHESRDFASMIQGSLAAQLQKTDRRIRNLGVKQAPFMVLLGATMPSVLAEISFITNRQDATLLKTEKYRQRIAEALVAGIIRYQQSLKRAPAVAEQ